MEMKIYKTGSIVHLSTSDPKLQWVIEDYIGDGQYLVKLGEGSPIIIEASSIIDEVSDDSVKEKIEKFKLLIPEDAEWDIIQNDAYKELSSNPCNFSFWYPKVKDCGIKTPESLIFPISFDLFKKIHPVKLDEDKRNEVLEKWFKDIVMPAIPEQWQMVFMKNGCFSNKFKFSTCVTQNEKYHLISSFKDIDEMSWCLDTGGNTELVIREVINPNAELLKIYNGMPLRPELRVFYDFDTKKTLYSANYWNYNYCKKDLNKTDCLVFSSACRMLDAFYEKHHKEIEDLVEKKMSNVKGMSGIWSVDILCNAEISGNESYSEFICDETEYYLIDMAEGFKSAYWDKSLTIPTLADKRHGRVDEIMSRSYDSI